MFGRFLTPVALATLSAGVMASPASAQHAHHAGGGGHAAIPHAVAPHPGYAHSNYHTYGGNSYYHPGYGHYYGYRNPYYYRPWSGVGFGVPYYSGFAYPDYSADYFPPDVIAPQPTTSAYPPAEAGPVPAAIGTARLTVQLPVDAKLWIDGQLTTQTGSMRLFETPAVLEPGREYSYRLRAEWVENGQPVTRERQVTFRAGNQSLVNLTVS